MPTVLIVDDDDVDRELASRCLRPLAETRLDFAEDGATALERVARDQPDLVITDLRMPAMDGLELVERLRQEHPLVPVILMTSQGNEQIAVRALKAGAASYVPKSHLKKDLLETTEEVLELSEARRSRRAIVRYLGACKTSFELDNDPELIYPLVGFFQENLERLGWSDEGMRTQVGVALMEAVSNAMIHGNLEVGSTLKREDREGYEKLIVERRGKEPYNQRRVRFEAHETEGGVEYTVRDEGPGFDYTSLPDPTATENLLRVSGRGIMLIRTFMDEVEFNETGNRIVMKKAAPVAAC